MPRQFDYLGDIEVFMSVAHSGSITAAAITLGTTPSVVSRTLMRLEKRLGVSLLRRTTRHIALTPAGKVYLQHTVQVLAQMDNAAREIQKNNLTVIGKIKISAPTTFGHYRLPSIIMQFKQRYPEVELELNISNRNVDLISEGYDFAIRLGQLQDSSLVARKLFDATLCLVASPSYIERHGMPTSLDELAHSQHCCLPFIIPSTGRCIPWLFSQNKQELDWTPPMTVKITDDVLGVVSLAESGVGICQTYDFIVQAKLDSGKLIDILPELRGRSRSFFLIYIKHGNMSAAVKAFIKVATGSN